MKKKYWVIFVVFCFFMAGYYLNSYLLLYSVWPIGQKPILYVIESEEKIDISTRDLIRLKFKEIVQGVQYRGVIAPSIKVDVSFMSTYDDELHNISEAAVVWYFYHIRNESSEVVHLRAGILSKITGKIFKLQPKDSIYVSVPADLPPRDNDIDNELMEVLREIKIGNVVVGYYKICATSSGVFIPQFKK